MNSQVKTRFVSLLEPKSILLGLALFNFIHIWVEAERMSGIACVVCPWYHPWKLTNETTVLLLAAVFLRFGKSWANILAGVCSGYLVARFIYLFLTVDITLFQEMRYVQKNAAEILVLWDFQYLFAAVIFSFSLYYLVRGRLCKSA